MSKAVGLGWKVGAYTAFGSLTAITLIMTLSFMGLGIVIVSSEVLFNLIKWCGAGYLIFLGIKALTSKQNKYDSSAIKPGGSHRFTAHYISGFMVGASNPKAILFFTALFPQFINPSENLWVQYWVFAITFIVLELSWLLFYAYLGAKSSRWIFTSGNAKFFNRLTGGVFIGAAVGLSMTNKS